MDKTDDGDDTGAAGGEQVGLDSEAEVGDGDGQGGGSAGKGADNGEEELPNDGDPSQVHGIRVRVLGVRFTVRDEELSINHLHTLWLKARRGVKVR